jgi:acetyl-CoA carboxylase carboxyltransferase component
MSTQVHHVAQLDRDVAEEVTNWLKYLKGQVTSVQFLTTTVPDPKEPEKWRVQYEAYITYQR